MRHRTRMDLGSRYSSSVRRDDVSARGTSQTSFQPCSDDQKFVMSPQLLSSHCHRGVAPSIFLGNKNDHTIFDPSLSTRINMKSGSALSISILEHKVTVRLCKPAVGRSISRSFGRSDGGAFWGKLMHSAVRADFPFDRQFRHERTTLRIRAALPCNGECESWK